MFRTGDKVIVKVPGVVWKYDISTQTVHTDIGDRIVYSLEEDVEFVKPRFETGQIYSDPRNGEYYYRNDGFWRNCRTGNVEGTFREVDFIKVT